MADSHRAPMDSAQTSLHPDVNDHRQTRTQSLELLTLIEHDLHWNALNNLYVIPGRIFRRQQAEAGAGGRSDAVDATLQALAAKRIHRNGYGLARMHIPELRFFEVRCDPDVIAGNDGHQRLTGLNHLTRFRALLAHDSGHRRFNGRVFEIQPSLIEACFRELNLGVRRLGLCTGDYDLLGSGFGS